MATGVGVGLGGTGGAVTTGCPAGTVVDVASVAAAAGGAAGGSSEVWRGAAGVDVGVNGGFAASRAGGLFRASGGPPRVAVLAAAPPVDAGVRPDGSGFRVSTAGAVRSSRAESARSRVVTDEAAEAAATGGSIAAGAVIGSDGGGADCAASVVSAMDGGGALAHIAA